MCGRIAWQLVWLVLARGLGIVDIRLGGLGPVESRLSFSCSFPSDAPMRSISGKYDAEGGPLRIRSYLTRSTFA